MRSSCRKCLTNSFGPEALLDQLDRHLAAKVSVISQINFAHAAFAEQRNNPVVTRASRRY